MDQLSQRQSAPIRTRNSIVGISSNGRSHERLTAARSSGWMALKKRVRIVHG